MNKKMFFILLAIFCASSLFAADYASDLFNIGVAQLKKYAQGSIAIAIFLFGLLVGVLRWQKDHTNWMHLIVPFVIGVVLGGAVYFGPNMMGLGEYLGTKTADYNGTFTN